MSAGGHRPPLLTPWRRALQTFWLVLFLALPWGRLGGYPLVWLDVPGLRLHLLGLTLQIEELYLFWLLSGALVFGFLAVTFVLGRVWCGWACPQTVLADLAEGLAHRLRLTADGVRWRGTITALSCWYLALAVVAVLWGMALVWYFVPPPEFLQRVAQGRLTGWPLGTLLVVAVAVFLDMALVRRLVCREFCPYGRFQTVLVDAGTLTLRYHPDEAPRCIDCRSCVRACPMGIDIRDGFQIECINCASCLDACRKVMARRGEPGIIRYTFGTTARGWRALFNPRLGMVVALFVTITAALLVVGGQRAPASLKVRRLAAVQNRPLAHGRTGIFYSAYLENRTDQPSRFSLSLQQGGDMRVQGQVSELYLKAGQRRQVNFVVSVPRHHGQQRVVLELRRQDGVVVATSPLLVPALPASTGQR